MNLKKYLSFFIKMMVSGVLALVILSALCLIYYNPPMSAAQPDGYTNWKYVPNSSWRFMTEGHGHGTINSLGYNDPQDPTPGVESICFLGSSQTEARQIDQNKSFTSLLETMISSDASASNDYQCLNLGISGHFFEIVVSNFQNFADSFDDVRYAVIEINYVEFTEEEVERMLKEEYHSDYGARSLLSKALQKIPYLRLVSRQLNDLQKNKAAAAPASVPSEVPSYENYAAILDPVMGKLSRIAQEHNFELIILKHSRIALDEEGNAYAQGSQEALEQFRQSCEANGIGFICTDDLFCEYVNTHQEMPYGFPNAYCGEGHLNEVGHQLITQLLYSELFAAKEG